MTTLDVKMSARLKGLLNWCNFNGVKINSRLSLRDLELEDATESGSTEGISVFATSFIPSPTPCEQY